MFVLLLLVVLIVLLAVVAALTIADWWRAPGRLRHPRGHLLVIVLVVLALFVWATAHSLFGSTSIDYANDGPWTVVTAG